MNSICPHFSSILFCLQLVCRMFKHKLLKAVAVLQLIERVLVFRVLFPPISPKFYRLLTISYFILLVLLFLTASWPHGPKNMLFFLPLAFGQVFFLSCKRKKKDIKFDGWICFSKGTIEFQVCGHDFFFFTVLHTMMSIIISHCKKNSALHQKMKE